jgi:hypothetical protein
MPRASVFNNGPQMVASLLPLLSGKRFGLRKILPEQDLQYKVCPSHWYNFFLLFDHI